MSGTVLRMTDMLVICGELLSSSLLLLKVIFKEIRILEDDLMGKI